MKRIATLFAAVGLATAGAPAIAEQAIDQMNDSAKPQPMLMSDAQLDNVAAGQIVTGGLIDIVVNDVTVVEDGIRVRVLEDSLNNLTVQVPVAANVGAAVAVLGNAAAVARQFGRQF